MPCDQSSTTSRSGQRVWCSRVRRSSSTASGTSIVNGLISSVMAVNVRDVLIATRTLPAVNVVLTGFMGTGKTTVGRLLAARLGFGFVDTDAMIEESARADPRDLRRAGRGRVPAHRARGRGGAGGERWTGGVDRRPPAARCGERGIAAAHRSGVLPERDGRHDRRPGRARRSRRQSAAARWLRRQRADHSAPRRACSGVRSVRAGRHRRPRAAEIVDEIEALLRRPGSP